MPLVILGAGVVGVELALRAARHGCEVILHDVDAQALRRAQQEIARKERFSKLLGAGQHPGRATDSIAFVTEEPFARAQELLIEAVVEEPEVKASLLARAGAQCPAEVIFASTTSAIPITWLAERSGRPDRMIGTHFMTPVSMSSAVEVAAAPGTSPATLQRTLAWLSRLQLEPVVVNDNAGFVSNRVLMLAINEAVALVEEKIADAPGVDRVFTACFAHPLGPLALADLIGLDTVVRTLHVLRRFTGAAKFEPHPLLMRLVKEQSLGQKSGRGFYEYT